VAVLAAIVLSVVVTSTTVEKCVTRIASIDNLQAQVPATFSSLVRNAGTIVRVCAREYIENNHLVFEALAAVCIAIFTATLWWSTRRLWQASIRQSADTQSAIGEAARSANAIEIVGNKLADSVRQQQEGTKNYRLQVRAYVSVIVGTATPQDRERNIPFQVQPSMVNAGFTPARKVRWAIRCALAPYPLPSDFAFEKGEVDPDQGTINMGPHQALFVKAELPHFVEGEEAVAAVKAGVSERLYVWGTIFYEDVFEQEQHTDFCHCVVWLLNDEGKEVVGGDYPGRHNDAT
jgi:hypothetical protein